MDTLDQEVDKALSKAVQHMGYQQPHCNQRAVVKSFLQGRNVFVSLLTGSEKSFCYCCLPLVIARIQPQITSPVGIIV